MPIRFQARANRAGSRLPDEPADEKRRSLVVRAGSHRPGVHGIPSTLTLRQLFELGVCLSRAERDSTQSSVNADILLHHAGVAHWPRLKARRVGQTPVGSPLPFKAERGFADRLTKREARPEVGFR